MSADFNDMLERFDSEGLFWTVFLVSLLPAPMQLATLGAGAASGNIAVFLAAIALSRGIRYFGLAVAAQFVGERIAQWNVPRRYLIPGLVLTLFVVWGILQLI